MASTFGQFIGKTAIVTGGSNGIGKGIAAALANHGGKVAILDIDGDAGRKFEMNNRNKVTFIRCDLSKQADIQTGVQEAIRWLNGLDLLVNNVAIFPTRKPIDDITEEEFRKVCDVNLMSYFFASKYALPYLRKAKGSIINISSVAGKCGARHTLAYTATKGANNALTKGLAIDESPNGVRVNTIITGPIKTPLWDTVDDEFKIRVKQANLMKRFGLPEEVGELALFLATSGTFITGTHFEITGGIVGL